ncbi:MAG: class I adenylate-forming enzyme family protein [Pseudomonadota bacterium]
MEEINIFQIIEEETREFGHKTAVVDGPHRVSYGDIIAGARRAASSLKGSGVSRFDRVGLLCEDSVEYIVLSLAVLSLHAVVVPVPPEQSPVEIETAVKRIDINFLLFEKSLYSREDAIPFIPGVPCSREFYLKKRDTGQDPCREYFEINPAFIRFTSGTTGVSKGVVLSHESILERTESVNKGFNLTSDDIVLWVLSMSFHFVATILLFLRRAATIVLCSNRFPLALMEGILKEKGTFIYASPFHYNLLMQSELAPGALQSIRLAVSTAVRLPEETGKRFYERFGLMLTEAYGIIEIGIPFINLSKDPRPGSVGKILPDYEISVLNKDAQGIGEIYVRGKGMLDAYFSPWQNREAILEKGWFKTGDLGRVDDEDNLTIIGRNKDVINFAGMKIFPAEVESVLNRHPAVDESWVFGVEHPQYGQLPVAKIVPAAGSDGLDVDGLRQFCYQNLAKYKVPKDFECVDRLPKTASGKIKR